MVNRQRLESNNKICLPPEFVSFYQRQALEIDRSYDPTYIFTIFRGLRAEESFSKYEREFNWLPLMRYCSKPLGWNSSDMRTYRKSD